MAEKVSQLSRTVCQDTQANSHLQLYANLDGTLVYYANLVLPCLSVCPFP